MKTVPPMSDDELIELGRASRRMENAPQAALEHAFAIWRPRSAAPSVLQRLVARLRFDDAAAAMAPALRSAKPRVRQMIFSVNDVDIDLRIEAAPKPGAWTLRGQVLGMPTTSTAVLHFGDQVLHASCDEFGAFHFDEVPSGALQLGIQAADLSVELPSFDVGPDG